MCASKGGRGGPGRTLGGGNRGTEADYCGWGTVATNIKGTESSVSVAYVWGLQQLPNMITLWVHRDWSKIKKNEYIYIAMNILVVAHKTLSFFSVESFH